MFDFEIKIADTKREVEQVLRLRHEIFHVELGAGVRKQNVGALDMDKNDQFCDHLLVIDKMKGKIVGTYRLMLGSKANKEVGFYSEKFFTIDNIKNLSRQHEILELGRSCVHREYRSRLVINLLWNGIAKYSKDNNVRYLFGATRLLTNEQRQVNEVYAFLKEKFYTEGELRVYPKAKNRFIGLTEGVEIKSLKKIMRCLPPLLRGYLRAGVLVCGPPAVNTDLGSVVIFVLLDVERIPQQYKRHFFQNGLL